MIINYKLLTDKLFLYIYRKTLLWVMEVRLTDNLYHNSINMRLISQFSVNVFNTNQF